MKLPWNTDFKAERASSVRTPFEMNSSLRPASLASRIDDISDPRRGSGGYYHPALHISDLSIPDEEEPVLLPFQTKESAYPLQKLVDRVIFLKIYSDTVETDFNLVPPPQSQLCFLFYEPPFMLKDDIGADSEALNA